MGLSVKATLDFTLHTFVIIKIKYTHFIERLEQYLT